MYNAPFLIRSTVDGRMNVITGGVCPIIIDYAHNELSVGKTYWISNAFRLPEGMSIEDPVAFSKMICDLMV